MSAEVLAIIETALESLGITDNGLRSLMVIIHSLACEAAPHRPARLDGSIAAIKPSELPKLSTIARQFLRGSLRRSEAVGTPIEDASWNMMLAIYADAADGGITSTTSACYASGVPATTALRHLERLRHDGLISRENDPFDRRRSLLAPTPQAIDRMEAMIRAFCIPRPAQPLIS